MIRSRAFLLSLLGLGFTLGAARPGRAADLRHVFAKAATIAVDRRGPATLVRLTLPTEVIAACRADLSDLRLLDARGAETAFVWDRGAPWPPAPTKLKTVPARMLAAEHHQSPRAGAEPLLEESYELASPPAPPKAGSWELVLEVTSPRFVRRLQVFTISVEGQRAPLVSDESVFRLADNHGERLRVPLPGTTEPRLRVTLAGEASAPLEPRFHFEAIENVEPAPVASVELVSVHTSTPIGRTVVQLARPSGLVPSGLRLDTTTTAFSRAIEIRDIGGTSQGTLLGSAVAFRIQGLSLFQKLEVPLEPAQGRLLEVSIEDGDSPPLSALKFSALLRAPSLVFSLPATEAAQAPTLYFGGGRVHAPRYDLATLGLDGASDGASERERAAHSLFDPAQLSSASVREIRENPGFDRAPALGFAMHPGALLDAKVYTHLRRVELAPSIDGVAEIPLSARDLSLLRADLADLRVIDGMGRQWPFLLQEARRDELVGLTLGELERDGRSSRRQVRLPFAPLSANALVLDTRETYFDRAFRLDAELVDGRKTELVRGRLTRAVEGRPPLALVLEFPPTRVRSLDLFVEDGDNAPLALDSVRARVPVPSLLVVAEKGSYQLLLGNPSAEPARYDIESARALVLSVATERGSSLPLAENPAYRAASRLVTAGGPERVALWLALGLAVLLLGGMTFRLVHRENEDGSRAPR